IRRGSPGAATAALARTTLRARAIAENFMAGYLKTARASETRGYPVRTSAKCGTRTSLIRVAGLCLRTWALDGAIVVLAHRQGAALRVHTSHSNIRTLA